MTAQATQPQTNKGSVIAEALAAYFETRMTDLGLAAVYYGDQQKIPQSPTLTVNVGEVTRTLVNSGMQTQNAFKFDVVLYDARLSGVESIQLELDQLAEEIADELNQLGQLNGLIIYGYASNIEYGYMIKSNRLLRANRITWQAESRTVLV